MFKRVISTIKYIFSSEKEFYCKVKKITGAFPCELSYYKLALSHGSLMLRDKSGVPLNNQRLEFLGDAVLSLIIAHDIYLLFPQKDEGGLTKIRSQVVNRHILNQIAFNLGLDKLIKTRPIIYNLANTHIPGDALEALIGAVYMDLGIKQASKFIRKKIISNRINISELAETDTNYKSLILEWGQKYKYQIKFDTEPFLCTVPERETFLAKVYANNKLIGEGKGANKKEAHQNAASQAFEYVSDKSKFNIKKKRYVRKKIVNE